MELFSNVLLRIRNGQETSFVATPSNVSVDDDFLVFSAYDQQKITLVRADLVRVFFEHDDSMLLEDCPESFYKTLIKNLPAPEPTKDSTNEEVLIFGLEHIAKNHGFEADTDWSEDGVACIFGGCNVPTLSDVKMLCEDCGLPADCVESDDFGIEIEIPKKWSNKKAYEKYKGMNLWRRGGKPDL